MDQPAITSLQNPRIKHVVKLRKRSERDAEGLLLVEGYREILRALDNAHALKTVYHCPSLYLGENEAALLEGAASGGAEIIECAETPFRKMAYRDRPDGLLAVADQVRWALDDLSLPGSPLLLVAEHIEKPGNLGTILRSADGAGADAVIVCDRSTDINNPNVVRASIGTLFARPVAEASTEETLRFLKDRAIRIVSATPEAESLHTEADLSGPLAIVVGAEQYGLSDAWRGESMTRVRIPMQGQADSLNVGTAAAILLYEAVRQRSLEGEAC